MEQNDYNFVSKEAFEQCKNKGCLGIFEGISITDEEIDRIVDKFNSIPEVYPISCDDLRKILEKQENESK